VTFRAPLIMLILGMITVV